MDDRALGLALDAEAVDALGRAALASLLRLRTRPDGEPIFRADPAGLIEQLPLPPPEAPEMLSDIRPSADGSWCAWRSSASAPRSAKSTASWN